MVRLLQFNKTDLNSAFLETPFSRHSGEGVFFVTNQGERR